MEFMRGGAGSATGMIIVLALALTVILLRNSRPRKLKIVLLWIRPAIFVAILAATFAANPPGFDLTSMGLLVLALLIGCALGWQRGRFMHIEVDPATDAVTARASPVGILFILAILVVRVGLRGALIPNHALFGMPASSITDALFLVFASMIVIQSLEMGLRARRLIGEARTAKAAVPSPAADPPIVR